MKRVTVVLSSQIEDRFKELFPIDKNQEEFFEKRTKEHINRVRKNAKRISEKFPDISTELLRKVRTHDVSKFKSPEYFPYVWLTSVLDLGYTYPSTELAQYVHDMWKYHYKNNDHHPEHWITKSSLQDMPKSALAHMVADWASMSQEFNTSLALWWKYKASEKYDFTEEQKEHITAFLTVFPELLR